MADKVYPTTHTGITAGLLRRSRRHMDAFTVAGSSDDIPIADTTGTVDISTYDNTLTGTGKLRAVVIPSGDNGGPVLAAAVEGDAFPQVIIAGNSQNGIYLGDGTFDPTLFGAEIYYNAFGGKLQVNNLGAGDIEVEGNGAVRLNGSTVGGNTAELAVANGDMTDLPAEPTSTIGGLLAPDYLGSPNTAAATTPGSVVKKLEIFDSAGASLGFIAIYDSIT